MEPITLSIVGVDRYTDLLIEILRNSDRMKLASVCGQEASFSERYKQEYPEIGFYNDPREMLLRDKPDIILLWKDFCGREFIKSVVKAGKWCILRPPLSGGLSFVNEMIAYSAKNNVGLYIWSPWLSIPSYQCANDWCMEKQIRSCYARVQNSLIDMELPAKDELMSAIMYPHILLIQKWMGLPQQVYCQQRYFPGHSPEDRIQFFGLIDCIYQKSSAILTACLNAGPLEEEIIISSQDSQIQANLNQAKLFSCQGKLLDESRLYPRNEARKAAYQSHFERIWQCYMEEQTSTDFELKSHLGIMIILEAAKLSSKTGQPEDLSKIAELNEI